MLLSALRPAFWAASLALSLSSPALAGILYVDADLTSGANNGSSWANAFQGATGLQAALAAAVSGDEIYVAEGRYVPTATTTRTIAFALKNGVAIYGSFVGNEVTPAERPPLGTIWSVLDGDLLGNDGSGGLADNSFHLITTAGTNSSAFIDGFTVRGGNANGATAGNNDRGGGILVVAAVSPTIQNCLFTDNRCTFGGAAGYINNGGAPTFINCTFQNGNGGNFGGAFDVAGGGNLRFERCTFQNNTAQRAGALEIFASTGPVVSNCLFRANTSTGTGGGGGVWLGNGGNPQIRNCTIVGNFATANAVAGLRNQGSTNATVVNCVIFDNQGPGGVQGAGNQANTGTLITYSAVEGGYAGTGNISADPQFVNAAGLDFRLSSTSPAVDAGNNSAVPVGSIIDLAGQPRFQNVPGVVDTGLGTAPLVDMGAYETAAPAFVALPGCFGNTANLSSTSPALAINQSASLSLSAGLYPTGLGLYYLGFDGTNLSGCGLVLPGIGEVLLALAPFPSLLGTSPTVAGSGSFLINVPNTPSLIGQTVAFQAANVDLIGAGNPVELSNALEATIAP